MSTDNRITVRSIPEGRGGTFNYRSSPSHNGTTNLHSALDLIPYIGTKGVLTCVGVYFRVSETQCFVAHINGVIVGDNERTRLCTDEEGLRLKDDVVKQLTAESKVHGWSLQPGRIAKSLRIVCVKPRDVVDESGILAKQSGWWIVQGICDFLGVEGHQIGRQSGFVVDLNDESVQMLDYVPELHDVGRPGGDELGYDWTDEPTSKTQDWTIRYVRED